MKRLIIYIILVISLLTTCSDKKTDPGNKNKNQYEIVLYRLNHSRVSKEKVTFTQTQKKDTIFLKYTIKLDNGEHTTFYSLIKEKDSYFKTSSDIVKLEYRDVRLFYFNGKKFYVYKYVSDPISIDGCVIYFWCPDFGVILTKPNSWPGLTKLHIIESNDEAFLLESLIDLVITDNNFFRGCHPHL